MSLTKRTLFMLTMVVVSTQSTSLLAQPAVDYGLFNSGVDDSQMALADNAVDPHYELIDPSHVIGDAIVATSAGGFPIPPWLDDTHVSAWITPSVDTNGPGDFDGSPSYVYRTTFNLNDIDIDRLVIDGQWASDNSGQDILLNGESLGFVNTAQFGGFTPFTLDFGFVNGLNTLDFVINNGANEDNPDGPTGVRVEFDGNGTAAPPPPPPHPHAIASLYPTGVNEFGQALEGDLATDPHYRIVLDPFDEEQEALTVPNDGYPIPPWFANNNRSRWISPPDVLDGHDAMGEPGIYVYETKFNLEGKDIDNAAIVLARGTDDAGPTVLLNGVEIPAGASRGFGERSWMSINSASAREAGADFVAGENTLAFVVENGGEDVNPTGLRIDNVHARAAPEGSVRIPGLFNTGVSDDDLALPDFEVDPHYEMNVSPDGAIGPATALGGPPSAWAENSDASRWIGPDNSPAGEGPPGDYEFTIEFDLTGLDASTATIMGTWSADNTGGDILLNGEATGNAQAGSFPFLSPFEISNEMGHSFLPGKNSLTFLLNNAGDADNPAGLRVDGLVAFAMAGGLGGDYNGNGVLDAADIDLLATAVMENSDDLRFDANADGAVTGDDRQFWVTELANTWIGDSNMDGEFNSTDFVVVFGAGEYEDELTANSTWATGDWNGDKEFNSSDFVAAFSDGGYEKGPRPAPVPEPSATILLLMACVMFVHRRARES
ncbi:MAG: PEP-CTERM sorting domain-containing protein [Planctomycetales bacterium]|nr:PEP-CTERM sorting domain-containing protein [Planctomycetales bacterium]